MTELKVKEWIVEREQNKAARYDRWIDYARRNDDGTPARDGDFVWVIATVETETEKAVKVTLETGAIVGSVAGWSCWIPKSQIAA